MNRHDQTAPVRLALEDGTVVEGRGFGDVSPGTVSGEVVFNTSMTGYQEALTDPSYAGQILIMTAAQIGNYGVCARDVESGDVQVAGFIVRELSRTTSNQRAETDLSSWLAAAGVPGLSEVDTRALVRRLRSKGALRGVLSSESNRTDVELVEAARSARAMTGRNLAADATPAAGGVWTEPLGAWRPMTLGAAHEGAPLRVVAIDCGAKRNIYRHLVERGCTVEFVRHDASAEEILARKPDGIFVSNGPGDPAAVQTTIDTLKTIIAAPDHPPAFGICLGHQLLALALGATTYKLKFGHRGANQPVRCLLTGRVEITSQNHGFCVDEASLVAAGAEVTHVHLNDRSVAGFRHRTRPVFAVQHHPEASPGPHDSAYLFDWFIAAMREHRSPAPDGEAAARGSAWTSVLPGAAAAPTA